MSRLNNLANTHGTIAVELWLAVEGLQAFCSNGIFNFKLQPAEAY